MRKRSISLCGHRTSLLLENEFWEMLELIAHEKECSLAFLINEIDQQRQSKNLASHLRLFVLNYLKERITLHAPSTA